MKFELWFKKFGLSLVVFIFLSIIHYSLFILPTYAHVLKTDGSIGAVLHIDPDDDPIAGSQSGFFFEFKDKQNKFSPQYCTCTFSIVENGKEIYSQPLFQNNSNPSLTTPSVFYTFAKKDVYQLRVTGVPNPADSFQTFTLTYDVRVERVASPLPTSGQVNTTNTWISKHLPHLALGLIIGVFIIVAMFKQSFTKPKA
ncbi:MAG TPA: hypothetical protein VLE91_00245 [Candidatus Saccharimonadales bacterium]|nr:hypothetical protein [Candidatus Saccharimonadales bacterium]